MSKCISPVVHNVANTDGVASATTSSPKGVYDWLCHACFAPRFFINLKQYTATIQKKYLEKVQK